MSKVLLVGNLADEKWIGNLIKRLKQSDPDLRIDFFWSKVTSETPSDAADYCEKIFRPACIFPRYLYKIPKLRISLKEKDINRSFKSFINNCKETGVHYDVVNFHYLNNETLSCWEEVQTITDRSLLMPWGSDVLRRSKSYTRKMREYVMHYDYVCASDNPRFRRQLEERLNIKEEQFVDLDFGSESIDRLMENAGVGRDMAKKALGIDGRYVITVGYNAHEEQHHIEIIDALLQIKDKLPRNYLLVFPMTYGGKQHVTRVEQKLKQTRLEYVIYDKYLSYQDVVYLRKCADVFIHAQTTDANSASLAEYLFCQSSVVNASWLKYDHFEEFGMPYYTFSSFSELPGALENAIVGGTKVNDSLVEYIKGISWSAMTKKWLSFIKNH